MSGMTILLFSINFVTNNGDEIIREYTARGFKPWILSFGLMPPQAGSFSRSKVYTQVGLFNTSYRIAGDFNLFMCISYQMFSLQSYPVSFNLSDYWGR